MRDRTTKTGSRATWPYASLLIFGFFGAGTPAGRRLAWRTAFAFLLIAAGIVVLSVRPQSPGWLIAWALVIPLGAVVIVAENVRYLQTLDELSRSLQVRAFAAAYGAAMVAAGALLALHLAAPPEWRIHEVPMVALVVLAEPLRGLALVRMARRYE